LARRKQELKTKGYFIKDGKKITKLGRPKGRKDKPGKPRRKSGYYQRWANKKTTLAKNEYSVRGHNDR
jgi:hypothetical protein